MTPKTGDRMSSSANKARLLEMLERRRAGNAAKRLTCAFLGERADEEHESLVRCLLEAPDVDTLAERVAEAEQRVVLMDKYGDEWVNHAPWLSTKDAKKEIPCR